LLKQPLNSPMPVEEQVVVVFAGTKGYLDDVPVNQVRTFEAGLLDFMRTRNAGVLAGMRSNPKADVPGELGDLISAYKEQFATAAKEAAGRAVDPASVDADEVGAAKSNKTLATE
jgi:F-type H+-transporting ATPase subunit alpha